MQSLEFSFWFFIIRLVMGGVAGFFAIFYLSKTRDLAWVFMIVGTLLLYAYFLFDTLYSLRIVSFDFTIFGVHFVELFSIIMSNLPLVFIALGFITIIIKNR
ncbi:MAG: hypothetical protein P8107_14780 [Spirochaetia bacterium]